MAKSRNPSPPSRLSRRSKRLLRELTRGGVSPGRLALITAALEHRDRADALRDTIHAEGATFKTRKTGAMHMHPACALEARERQRFEAIFLRLHLEFDPMIDGAALELSGAPDERETD